MTVERCKGITKDGKPCAAKPRPGTEVCPWHSADLAERRREWSRRGGINSSNRARARKALPANVMTMQELHGVLGLTIRGVLSGRVEPSVANSVASLARAMTTVAEAGEFEQRLAALEVAAERSTA